MGGQQRSVWGWARVEREACCGKALLVATVDVEGLRAAGGRAGPGCNSREVAWQERQGSTKPPGRQWASRLDGRPAAAVLVPLTSLTEPCFLMSCHLRTSTKWNSRNCGRGGGEGGRGLSKREGPGLRELRAAAASPGQPPGLGSRQAIQKGLHCWDPHRRSPNHPHPPTPSTSSHSPTHPQPPPAPPPPSPPKPAGRRG